MLRCPRCGNLIYPKIAPAVIVALTDGDRLLMYQAAWDSSCRSMWMVPSPFKRAK